MKSLFGIHLSMVDIQRALNNYALLLSSNFSTCQRQIFQLFAFVQGR